MLRDWVDLIENHTFAVCLAFVGLLTTIHWTSVRLVWILQSMREQPPAKKEE